MPTTQEQSILNTLSPERMQTYEKAAGSAAEALRLYLWNIEVSGAFWMPLHLCEVVIRNAVSAAIANAYQTPDWIKSRQFLRSLPTAARDQITRALPKSNQAPASTSMVIPELKFIFWQKMFTERHDDKIWNSQIWAVFPNIETKKPAHCLRQEFYSDLDSVRRLRNRIAHHEPIFQQDLADDLERLIRLVGYRCSATQSKMKSIEKVSTLLQEKPPSCR